MIESKIPGAKVIESFIFFMILPFILIGYSIFKKKTVNEQIGLTPPPVEQPIVITGRSLNDIVGRYKGLDICRHVESEDNRTFVFESIAVEHVPGVYFSDNPAEKYIVVDKHLLYREVPGCLDK